jgi:acetyl-CoA/propionyl-CoA carboxylase biotin carboxyl carrier protein
MVTGLDLVEQQLRVAAGEHLSDEVMAARLHGHSVEARIYAESPSRGFLPTNGRVLEVREPTGDGIRTDSALLEGLEVASDYDPMLAKVVTWGPDRAIALARLRLALEETVILGVETNVGFLGRLVANPDVVAGNLDTGLIEREVASLVTTEPSIEAFALYAMSWLSRLRPKGPITDPWSAIPGWRLGGPDQPLTLRVTSGGDVTAVVNVSGTLDVASVSLNDGAPVAVDLTERDGEKFITLNGESHRARFCIEGSTTWVCVGGETWPFVEEDVASRARRTAASSNDVRSPMPGTVVSARAFGEHGVRAGDALVVVSAMKMEHVLVAPRDGTVDILVREGDSVVVDEVVARLMPLNASMEIDP